MPQGPPARPAETLRGCSDFEAVPLFLKRIALDHLRYTFEAGFSVYSSCMVEGFSQQVVPFVPAVNTEGPSQVDLGACLGSLRPAAD
eukprot:2049294-Alexandrium_andersonii.AAC.1